MASVCLYLKAQFILTRTITEQMAFCFDQFLIDGSAVVLLSGHALSILVVPRAFPRGFEMFDS